MARSQQVIRKFLLFAFLFLLFSCGITKAMWKQGYQERIQYFAVTSDKKNIIFIGNDYHYVLTDDSSALKDLLAWQLRGFLMINTEGTKLKVDGKNQITGEVFIETVSANVSREQWSFLQASGFKRSKAGDSFFLKIKVSGERYLPRFEQDLSKSNLPALTMPYKIFITEQRSKLKTACIAALTPITMTLDGALTIGRVVLWPLSGS
jgi:hypothetical protein